MPGARSVLLGVLALISAPSLADREAGRDVFFSSGCISCHAIECNRAGPKLGGIMGRRAGGVADFEEYSEAFRNSAVIWTEATLDAFLADPEGFIPGNSMATASGKLADPAQRRDLIAFLVEPDSSLDLCF